MWDEARLGSLRVVGAAFGVSQQAERKIRRGKVGKRRFEVEVHFLFLVIFVEEWQLWELMGA